MSVWEVTIGIAALIELLQKSRDAMPLCSLVSLLEQALWKLQYTTGRGKCLNIRHFVFYVQAYSKFSHTSRPQSTECHDPTFSRPKRKEMIASLFVTFIITFLMICYFSWWLWIEYLGPEWKRAQGVLWWYPFLSVWLYLSNQSSHRL